MEIKFKTKIGILTAKITYDKQQFGYIGHFVEKPELQTKGTAIEEVLSLLNNVIEQETNNLI